jgi:ABC-2 type transport system permease protein
MTPSLAHPRFPWALLRFWIGRTLWVWCLIALAIFLIQIAVCGIAHDNERVQAYLELLEVMPSFIKSAIGGEELQIGNVSAFIGIGYQAPQVFLLIMLYAVGVPTGLLAGEVQQGRMELILSRVVTRTQVYVCATAITLVGMFALVLVMFLGTVAGVWLYEFEEEVRLYPFFKVAMNGGLLSSSVGGFALMCAAMFSRRVMAVSYTSGVLVVLYVSSALSEWWPMMEPLAPWTPFYYVDGPRLFNEPGWPWGDIFVLTSLLVVTVVIGAVAWRRRDLPL